MHVILIHLTGVANVYYIIGSLDSILIWVLLSQEWRLGRGNLALDSDQVVSLYIQQFGVLKKGFSLSRVKIYKQNTLFILFSKL